MVQIDLGESLKEENGRPVLNIKQKISFGRCDICHHMHLSDLLLLTSDAAVEDFDLRGYTWSVLKEKNLAILTSRISLHIHKRPLRDQLVTIRTWEEKPAGIQLSRRYEINDSETGELLLTGLCYWIVVDLETRRIVPAKRFTLRPEPEYLTEYDGLPPGKIAIPENIAFIEKRKIHYSELDSNGHTNNSKYGNFIIDCLPSEYQQKEIKDIKINYSKEAMLGEEIEIWSSIDSEANKAVVVGKGSEENCFECELYFQ